MTGALPAGAAPAGDPQPEADFEALLRPVLPRAYRAALHMARDPTDAEDLVQEAVLMALRGFGGFRPGTNFRAWFLCIVTNAFRMRCRKEKKTHGNLSLDETPIGFLSARLDESGLLEGREDPAASFFSRLDTEQVTEAIRALPAPYREVATLYFVEDLTYEEIGGILGCPVGTVRSRLHRARALLQKQLWRTAEECGIALPAS